MFLMLLEKLERKSLKGKDYYWTADPLTQNIIKQNHG
jgi:hypothetical protein